MTVWICGTCGVEHPDSERQPESCPICLDERQYVPERGQWWMTLESLAAEDYELTVAELEPDLYGIERSPEVAIGPRSMVLRTAKGNLLWDPPSFVDARVVDAVRSLGGVAAVAASHPHMFGSQVSWSHAFGGVPVYVNADDAHWVQRPDPVVRTWKDAFEVPELAGVTLVQAGGHFKGSAVAHWSAAPQGGGVLLTGDTIAHCADPRWVTFLRSYPNRIPLSATTIARVLARVEPYEFDRLYTLNGGVVTSDARGVVQRSAARYIGWVSGEFDADT